MEGYVITNDKVYICKSKTGNSYATTTLLTDATTWENKVKCDNVIKTLPKTYKNLNFKSKCVSIINENNKEEKFEEDELTEEFYDFQLDIDELVSNIEDSFKLLATYNKSINTKLKYVEKEIIDIEHAAEFYNLNASEGFKLYKMLQKARQDRRAVKDDMVKLEVIFNADLNSWINGIVAEVIFNKLGNRSYCPRVLKELFNR